MSCVYTKVCVKAPVPVRATDKEATSLLSACIFSDVMSAEPE